MILALVIGGLGAAGWAVAAWIGAVVMPSYLAAWLFWLAMPMGALPLVMVMEAMGGTASPMLPALRRTLLLLPVGAVLAIPVLARQASLSGHAVHALPAAWMAQPAVTLRTVAILVLLSLLALVFSRAPRAPRRGLAVAGLLLHIPLASVAAVDWVLALQPGLASSGIGLLLIAAQAGAAACLAAFVLAAGTRGRVPQSAGILLAVLLAAWAFLHFIQFLIVWSANLPDEIVWYQARSGGIVWFGVAAVALGLALLPSVLARIPAVLASLAAMLMLLHLTEMLWLVTPAFRGQFSVTLPDVLAMLASAGLLAGLMLLPRRAHHA